MKSTFRKAAVFIAALISGLPFCSCTPPDSADPLHPVRALTLVSEHPLPFTQPSGIAFSETMHKLWIVSGGDQHIYMLDTNGTVEKKLAYKGIDLEGIVFDGRDSTLWIIDEEAKYITHIDLDGAILFRTQLSYTSVPNKGPEGMTIGPNYRLFVVNQKNPGVLLELDSAYAVSLIYQLNFAADYSDLAYDRSSDEFAILSDESAAIFFWNSGRGVIRSYSLPRKGYEGMARDTTRNLFYLVNDPAGTMEVFR